MIDALFNQPNYVATKRLLDATAVRMEGIAANMANLETPNYRRVDVPAAFEAELKRAIASGDASAVARLRPQLAPDPTAVALRRDGNTVDLDSEMVRMYRASVDHAVETQFLTGTLMRMRLAITGRPS